MWALSAREISSGELLDTDDPSMKKAEELRVRDIIGSKYPAVRITVTMDALLESAMNQNFIPGHRRSG